MYFGIDANCPIDQLDLGQDLRIVNTDNETISSGSLISIQCNDTSLFLNPDESNNNTLQLECSQDGSFANKPQTMPVCVIKCKTEDIPAELGLSAPDASTFFKL